ncbi:MAG: hypothetical protein ABR499_06320 [Gemmatimonadaceae bacterium]
MPQPRGSVRPLVLVLAAAVAVGTGAPAAPAQTTVAGQRIDAEYTAKIKEYLQDPRITTELVDHLPASTDPELE